MAAAEIIEIEPSVFVRENFSCARELYEAECFLENGDLFFSRRVPQGYDASGETVYEPKEKGGNIKTVG